MYTWLAIFIKLLKPNAPHFGISVVRSIDGRLVISKSKTSASH